MLVRDAMTVGAEAIAPDDSLQSAAVRMREMGVGALVVCDDGRPVGILTDRDIVVRGIAEGRDPVLADVRNAMTPQVFCCTDTEDLAGAVERMETHAVRRIAVLDAAERLVGVLSVDDVALNSPVLAGEIIEHARDPERPRTSGFWCWWE